MQRSRGTIVQFGSGQPGEEDSAEFERELYVELGLKNPSIAFVPFHQLPEGENDWTRFLQIYRPLTSRSIELVELVPFARQPDPASVTLKLRDARIVVLGSGLVEPYMEALTASGLDLTLAELNRSGTVFFGYSAGTLALGEEFRLYQSGAEILELLEEVLGTVLKDAPVELAVAAFCNVFHPPLPSEQILELLQRRREAGPASIADEPFAAQFQAMTTTPGLRLLPRIACYPHFGAMGQCTLQTLELYQSRHPETLHIGLPNATALVTTFGPGGPRLVARGQHPRHRVTWIDAAGKARPCTDGDEIPLPPAVFEALEQPRRTAS